MVTNAVMHARAMHRPAHPNRLGVAADKEVVVDEGVVVVVVETLEWAVGSLGAEFKTVRSPALR